MLEIFLHTRLICSAGVFIATLYAFRQYYRDFNTYTATLFLSSIAFISMCTPIFTFSKLIDHHPLCWLAIFATCGALYGYSLCAMANEPTPVIFIIYCLIYAYVIPVFYFGYLLYCFKSPKSRKKTALM